MTTKPIFSVVIPIYNYAHTLERCVNSVMEQSSNNFEIILVNDGSTDNSNEVCQRLSSKYQNIITYLQQKNSGPSAARNNGLKHAKGVYITFLDADDTLLKGALEALTTTINDKHLNTAEAVILLGGHESVDESGKSHNHSVGTVDSDPHKNFSAYLIDKNLSISNGAIYFHHAVFKQLCFPEKIKNSEDIPVFALALANHPCIPVNNLLVRIYKHSDSLRNQAHFAVASGLGIVNQIFDSPLLPRSLQLYKKPFLVARLLSLFRTLYNDGQYKQARTYYQQAIKIQPLAILRLPYFRKYIKSLL